MNIRRTTIALLAVVLLATSLTACAKKDLVTLAKLDPTAMTVGDRYGNSVQIPNMSDFVAAMKSAKVVKNPAGVKSETEADYIFTSGQSRVYYDYQGKYLIYVDKDQKKTVYSADLTQLLSEVPGLVPRIEVGSNLDQNVSGVIEQIKKVKSPAAALFEASDRSILMVAAGEKPTSGYLMSLDGVTYANGTMIFKVRLTAPQGGADTVITYPCLEVAIHGSPDVEVQLISKGETGNKVEHVSLAKVASSQNVILLHPERGSLLTERASFNGFARLSDGSFTIEVEDGHNVLGRKAVTVTERAPEWGYFELTLDLSPATSPNGVVYVSRTENSQRVDEVILPISFGGK